MTGPCSCRPGMGVIFEEVKSAVKVALMLSGMHTVSRPGEEALAAACLVMFKCCCSSKPNTSFCFPVNWNVLEGNSSWSTIRLTTSNTSSLSFSSCCCCCPKFRGGSVCEVRIKWRHKVDAFSFPSGWMSPLTTLLLLLLLQQTLGDIVRGKACSQQVCAALLFVRTYVYVCVGGDADKDQLYTSLLVWWSQLD